MTDGIESALEQARAAAGELPVHVAGGPGTANQYLAAGLVDELRLQVAPVLFGPRPPAVRGRRSDRAQGRLGRPVSHTTHVHYRVKR